jgi:predicted regulator of Ras-like GTPase activity (Roadblock/LC7/MglB family)
MITETLTGLRDVDDVQGSFLLAGNGQLMARDLPALFHNDIFGEIGPRLVRLRETLETDGDDVSALTLRFADHKLHLRPIGTLLLGVITNAKVNGPALRMAINLVARRVASQGSRLEVEVPPATPAIDLEPDASTPKASPVGMRRAPGVMGRRDIVFRGNKL